MKETPSQKLDPHVKNVWRINDFLWITLTALCVIVPVRLIALDPAAAAACSLLTTATCLFYGAALILWLLVLPPIRYMRWRYEVSEQYLDIAKGIIWRKRYVIPFIRVQNTDTRQGPLLRAFKLKSVTVATAAEEHVIPGLSDSVADDLRERAAELARLAREDV